MLRAHIKISGKLMQEKLFTLLIPKMQHQAKQQIRVEMNAN